MHKDISHASVKILEYDWLCHWMNRVWGQTSYRLDPIACSSSGRWVDQWELLSLSTVTIGFRWYLMCSQGFLKYAKRYAFGLLRGDCYRLNLNDDSHPDLSLVLGAAEFTRRAKWACQNLARSRSIIFHASSPCFCRSGVTPCSSSSTTVRSSVEPGLFQ
jgi:hypothetical protein